MHERFFPSESLNGSSQHLKLATSTNAADVFVTIPLILLTRLVKFRMESIIGCDITKELHMASIKNVALLL